mmetsp:Transcript_71360/g.128443  ORF Transcript_71360/g.128443 Transcript_71360/m.128443 type:complete len:211 (-) Transcript_71360:1946-2578(-)
MGFGTVRSVAADDEGSAPAFSALAGPLLLRSSSSSWLCSRSLISSFCSAAIFPAASLWPLLWPLLATAEPGPNGERRLATGTACSSAFSLERSESWLLMELKIFEMIASGSSPDVHATSKAFMSELAPSASSPPSPPSASTAAWAAPVDIVTSMRASRRAAPRKRREKRAMAAACAPACSLFWRCASASCSRLDISCPQLSAACACSSRP